MKNFDTTLYFITDSMGFEEAEFLRRVEEALDGGATILQLREKNKSTMEYIDLAEKVHELTKKYNGTESDEVQGDEQFEIDDNRSLDKMYKDIEGEGLQPVLNDYLYV